MSSRKNKVTKSENYNKQNHTYLKNFNYEFQEFPSQTDGIAK